MNKSKILVDHLPDARWKEGRDLRLEALSREPQAFNSTFEEEANLTEKEWIIRNRNALYAFVNNHLVGMIVIIVQDNDMTRHIANIFGVYVKKSHRGMGIGKQLMKQVILKLREDGQVVKIKLSVNTEQIAAVKLYEKLGFNKIGIQKKEFYFNNRYYHDLLMELHL